MRLRLVDYISNMLAVDGHLVNKHLLPQQGNQVSKAAEQGWLLCEAPSTAMFLAAATKIKVKVSPTLWQMCFTCIGL